MRTRAGRTLRGGDSIYSDELRRGFDDAARDGVTREAGDVVDVELVHHLLTVLLHGLDADAEVGRNLLVHLALRDELQDLELARRELLAVHLHRAALQVGIAIVVEE